MTRGLCVMRWNDMIFVYNSGFLFDTRFELFLFNKAFRSMKYLGISKHS